jgi:hypothetical protein
MKRQPTGWEKIFANCISVRGSYPKYTRILKKKNLTAKMKNLIKNRQRT